MTTFYLIRHAVHDLVDRVLVARSIDIELNDAGRRQAMSISLRLKDATIDAFVSSPRRRALQTGDPLTERFGLRVEIANEIDELDAGVWSGLSFETLERDPRWHNWNASRGSARPPAGESMAELQARVVGYLTRLQAKSPDGHIAVVSHAEPIRAALMHFRSIALDDFLQVPVPPASIHRLDIADKVSVRLLPLDELPERAA